MGVLAFLSRRQPENVRLTTLPPDTNDIRLRTFGIERTVLGFDTSALIVTLNEAAIRQYGDRFHSDVRRADIASTVLGSGVEWIHSEFSDQQKGFIESRLFNIHIDANGIIPSIQLHPDTGPLEMGSIRCRLTHFPIPYSDGFSVEHGRPMQGNLWNVSNFLAYGPFRTGQFTVKRKDTFPTSQGLEYVVGMVKQTGARTFELMRHILRAPMEGRSGIRHTLRLEFDRRRGGGFNVYMDVLCYGSLQVASGALQDPTTVRVLYLGLVNGEPHPQCRFKNIEAKTQQYFRNP